MCEELPCHMCGELTEFICEDCDESVCENCCAVSTYMDQIEGTYCQECYDTSQQEYLDSCIKEEEIEDEKRKKRKKKNAKRRAWYNSPEQREKRRLIKIELGRLRREQVLNNMKELGNVLKGFRF